MIRLDVGMNLNWIDGGVCFRGMNMLVVVRVRVRVVDDLDHFGYGEGRTWDIGLGVRMGDWLVHLIGVENDLIDVAVIGHGHSHKVEIDLVAEVGMAVSQSVVRPHMISRLHHDESVRQGHKEHLVDNSIRKSQLNLVVRCRDLDSVGTDARWQLLVYRLVTYLAAAFPALCLRRIMA